MAEVVSLHPDYPPSTIVLAKVKGYPAWPAMVLEESILPENIVLLKPNPPKNASGQVYFLPVRFFSDDTYIWLKLSDMSRLEPESIERYLLRSRRASSKKKDVQLREAYELAHLPPEMGYFVTWGLRGERDLLKDVEPDFDEDDDDDLDDFEQYEDEPPKKKQKKAKTPVRDVPPIDDDSDWGLDEKDYDFDEGFYVYDDETEQERFSKEFPLASEISEHLATTTKAFNEVAEKLSIQLKEIDQYKESEVLATIKKVKGALTNLPKTVFAKSTLYRVMVAVLHMPEEVFGREKIRREVDAVLQDVFGLGVSKVTIADLEAAEAAAAAEAEEAAVAEKEVAEEAAKAESEKAAKEESEKTAKEESEKDSQESVKEEQDTVNEPNGQI